MKKNKLSGIYFKSAPTLLEKQIYDSFYSRIGPGDMPTLVGEEKNVKGIIVPHYDYEHSAPCSAWAYKSLAESKETDVFIIIGQSQKGSGITTEPFETPLGKVRVNQKLALKLTQKKNIKENNPLFEDDEFIESQLPFLQFLYGKNKTISILPILIDENIKYRELVTDLKESLIDLGLKAKIIVPTRFTSHGRNYNYLPFSTDVNKKVYELDKGAINKILAGDYKEFLNYVEENDMNTNNFLGIVFALLFIKPKKALLEQYYTTADVDKDFKNFVSFASITLE
ncbi:MAG: AmmeMemoRadiSam system protein B [Candidatus Woesearchaeota archaeon]